MEFGHGWLSFTLKATVRLVRKQCFCWYLILRTRYGMSVSLTCQCILRTLCELTALLVCQLAATCAQDPSWKTQHDVDQRPARYNTVACTQGYSSTGNRSDASWKLGGEMCTGKPEGSHRHARYLHTYDELRASARHAVLLAMALVCDT